LHAIHFYAKSVRAQLFRSSFKKATLVALLLGLSQPLISDAYRFTWEFIGCAVIVALASGLIGALFIACFRMPIVTELDPHLEDVPESERSDKLAPEAHPPTTIQPKEPSS
jgi:hypothetical protein